MAAWGRGVKNEDVLTEIRRLHEIAMARRVPFTDQKLAEALAAA